jgi:hypothetical protein
MDVDMSTKTKCWFESSNLIVPKMNEQYILKKDLSIGECNYPSGMVVYVKQYVPSKEYLDLKINLKSIPQDEFPLLHENLNSIIITFYDGNDYSKKLSQFYDYFEELDKDMTMADVLDVRQAMDKLDSGVRALRTAIDEMDGDCNSLIVDDYPFPHSYDEWVIGFYDWHHSVNENIDIYRHAIKSLGGKDGN